MTMFKDESMDQNVLKPCEDEAKRLVGKGKSVGALGKEASFYSFLGQYRKSLALKSLWETHVSL